MHPNKRGCPTCGGIDPKTCLRCRGKTRLKDWAPIVNAAPDSGEGRVSAYDTAWPDLHAKQTHGKGKENGR